MKKKLSVMAIPANEHKADNPYNYILNTSLEAQGVNVSGYNLRRFLLAKDFDILHLHWPENFLAGKTGLGALKAFAGFWAKIAYLKLRRKKIVWTVHNQAPHEGGNLRLMQAFYKLLYRYMDGFISLSNHGAEQVGERGVPPKKNCRDSASALCWLLPKSNKQKRSEENTSEFRPISLSFCFAGQIRPYKKRGRVGESFSRAERSKRGAGDCRKSAP